jgi:cyclic beta-1,2-glucan synthetase
MWGPTPLPIRERSPYIARHGQGYTRFEHTAHGIALELEQFVPLEDPIKLSRLKIRNLSIGPRTFSRLSLTSKGFLELCAVLRLYLSSRK